MESLDREQKGQASRAAAPSVKRRTRGREPGKRHATQLLKKPPTTAISTQAAGRRALLQDLGACQLPLTEALLTMFLVSWSLFSRLSRMKDSVSSSWGSAGRASPGARAEDHRAAGPRPGRQAQLCAGSAPLIPPPPYVDALASPPPAPPRPSPTCFSLSSISRRRADASCGGIMFRTRGFQPNPRLLSQLRASSASVAVTPTSALGPAPERAARAPLGVIGGSAPARGIGMGCGRQPSREWLGSVAPSQPCREASFSTSPL